MADKFRPCDLVQVADHWQARRGRDAFAGRWAIDPGRRKAPGLFLDGLFHRFARARYSPRP
ncbi:hypothetical protein [uncultured Sphingomonas sp.]|uniref:hypothetical protein n=1 Tax=uncultured Sphingomonas sp. TaxID=158754 RepID=UPI0035CB7742